MSSSSPETTTDLAPTNFQEQLIGTLGTRGQRLAEVAQARQALAEAESRLRSSEFRFRDTHKLAYAFVLKSGDPLEQKFYTSDYDDVSTGDWELQKVEPVGIGQVFTWYDRIEVDYDSEQIVLGLAGDWEQSHHSSFSQSGTSTRSEIRIPFERLGDIDVYEYYPDKPERTDQVCALLAAQLGVNQVVLNNGPLQDYRNVIRWQAEREAGLRR